MIKFKSQVAGGAAVAAVLSLAAFYPSPANGAVAGVTDLAHPATGVGSCTLKNPHPKLALRPRPAVALRRNCSAIPASRPERRRRGPRPPE